MGGEQSKPRAPRRRRVRRTREMLDNPWPRPYGSRGFIPIPSRKPGPSRRFEESDMAPRGVRRVCALVLAVLIAFTAGRVADAQVLYGSIIGNVTDSTGASVPGATVTIEQAETKLTRELVTDAAGAYHFTAVPSGTYNVTVTMTGFRSFGRQNVPVTLNSAARGGG